MPDKGIDPLTDTRCPRCDGSGVLWDDATVARMGVPCPTCQTTTMVTKRNPPIPERSVGRWETDPLSNTPRRNRLTTQPPHDKLHGRNNVQKSASRQVEA
jgi:hypothetical protein